MFSTNLLVELVEEKATERNASLDGPNIIILQD